VPFDPQTAVLSGLLRNPHWWHRAEGCLGRRCFASAGHRALFVLADRLRAKATEATLSHAARELGRGSADALAALGEVVAARPTQAEWGYALQELLRDSRRRLMVDGSRRALQLLQLGDQSKAEDVFRRMPAALDKMEGAERARVQDVHAEAEHVLDRQYAGPRMYSGVRELDELVAGFRHGQLVFWGAAPHHAKSSFSMYVAHRLHMEGRCVFVATLEMTAHQILCLLLTTHAHVVVRDSPYGTVGSGLPYAWFDDRQKAEVLTEKERGLMRDVIRDFSAGPERGRGRMKAWYPGRDATIGDIERRVEAFSDEVGRRVDAVFIDYLQIVPPVLTRASKLDALNDTILRAAHWSKTAFGGRGILLWTPWQMRRESVKERQKEDRRRYSMFDFGESSYVERNADILGWNMFTEGEDGRVLTQGLCKNRTTRRVRVGSRDSWVVRTDEETNFFGSSPEVDEDMREVGI
jgi:replicative DNA helicase